MNKYSKRMERLEAADEDLSLLVLTGESREAAIAKYASEHGPVAKHRLGLFLDPVDAQL